MRSQYILFLKNLLIFTVIIGAIAYGFTFILPATYITPTLPFQFFLFLATTLLVHYILLKGSEKRYSKFVNYYMLTTFLKLVFYMIIIVTYALLNKEDAIAFIISFFILYMAYTIFEFAAFYRLSKNAGHTGKKNNIQ